MTERSSYIIIHLLCAWEEWVTIILAIISVRSSARSGVRSSLRPRLRSTAGWVFGSFKRRLSPHHFKRRKKQKKWNRKKNCIHNSIFLFYAQPSAVDFWHLIFFTSLFANGPRVNCVAVCLSCRPSASFVWWSQGLKSIRPTTASIEI